MGLGNFGRTEEKSLPGRDRLPSCMDFAAGLWFQRILYFSRILSAIMAMNSELVGLPRLFWMV